MSLAEVKGVIQRFVQDDRNDLLIIKGNWGVGKTYFWNKTLAEMSAIGKIGHNHYSYVSLFGIDSLETLKNSIIAHKILSVSVGKNSYLSASFLGSKILSLIRPAEKIPYLKNISGGLASEFIFHLISDTLICFDDLERKSPNLNIKDILGLASYLKEQRNCKIAFILNDGTLDSPDREQFTKHNEKLVDIELKFAPLPGEVFEYIFTEDDNYYEIIKTGCNTLKIDNARILNRIDRSIQNVLPHLKNLEEKQVESIVKSLILFIWSYYDKDNQQVIPLSFLEDYADWRIDPGSIFSKDVTEEALAWKKTLKDFGYGRTDKVDLELISFVKEGYLGVGFFEELEKRENEKKTEISLDGYREAWNLYNHSFADNENEFLERLVAEYRLNYEYLSIGDLQAVVETLRLFQMDEIANSLIDEFVPLKMTYERYIESKWEPNFSMLKDPYLIAKLESLPQKTVPPRQFREVLIKIVDDSRVENEDIEFLANCDESEFYEFFKAEMSGYLPSCCRKLLSLKNYNTQSSKVVYEKTEKSLLKIAAESRINKIRLQTWFNIKI